MGKRRAKEAAQAPQLPAVPYAPTSKEVAARQAFEERDSKRRPCPPIKIKVEADGSHSMSIDHPDPALGTALMLEAVGSTSVPFLSGAMGHLGSISQRGQEIDLEQLNFALAVIQGIEPKDQLETMLATQMAAIQSATMLAAFKLNASTDPKRWEVYERSLNRLARTFAAQMEALKRYRSKGEQRVYVERVNVESGGQAVVGLVERGGGGV